MTTCTALSVSHTSVAGRQRGVSEKPTREWLKNSSSSGSNRRSSGPTPRWVREVWRASKAFCEKQVLASNLPASGGSVKQWQEPAASPVPVEQQPLGLLDCDPAAGFLEERGDKAGVACKRQRHFQSGRHAPGGEAMFEIPLRRSPRPAASRFRCLRTDTGSRVAPRGPRRVSARHRAPPRPPPHRRG